MGQSYILLVLIRPHFQKHPLKSGVLVTLKTIWCIWYSVLSYFAFAIFVTNSSVFLCGPFLLKAQFKNWGGGLSSQKKLFGANGIRFLVTLSMNRQNEQITHNMKIWRTTNSSKVLVLGLPSKLSTKKWTTKAFFIVFLTYLKNYFFVYIKWMQTLRTIETLIIEEVGIKEVVL